MSIRKTLSVGLSCATIALAGQVCIAQQLQRSGTITIHTGWKVTAEAIELAEKKVQGHGTAIGTSFNDKGSGPLHQGPATCFFTFFVVDGVPRNKGYCAFGDAEGDRLFTDWQGGPAKDGEGTEGINTIVGGTGKYAGIQGTGSWKSKDVGPNGQHVTMQRFEYRLP